MTKAEQIARAVVAVARFYRDGYAEQWREESLLDALAIAMKATNYWPMRHQFVTYARRALAG